MLEFGVLGPLEVWRDGRSVDVRGEKRRALLAILVLHANEVVRRERLLEELWGENPPATATASLHNQVSRLRRELGAEVVVTRPSGYVLRTEAETIDLNRFQRLVSEARQLPVGERADRLAEALALWRGSPLTDLGGEPALDREIQRLEDLRVDVLEQRINADLELGRSGELVPELEALVAEHPMRERLRAQLILALYRAGRQAEALETYRETRRVLIEELGIEPSQELRELERAILRQDPALAERHAPEPLPVAPEEPEPARRSRRGSLIGLALIVGLLGAAGAGAALLLSDGGDTSEAAAGPRATGTASGDGTSTRTTPSTRSEDGTPKQTTRGGEDAPGDAGEEKPAESHQPKTTSSTPSDEPEREGITRPKPKPSGGSTQVTAPPPPAAPRNSQATGPFLLADEFSDPAFNSALWDRTSAAAGISFVEDDRLELSIAEDAEPGGEYNMIAGQYRTNCALTGKFDARVSFQTLTWPQASGVFIALGADFPSDYAVASRASLETGEAYWSNFGSWSRIPTEDASGALRLTRTENGVTSYYRSRGRWIKLQTRPTPRAAHIVLQLASYPPIEFSGQPVSAAFDHFRATAQRVECPPGAPIPPRLRK